MAVIQISKIQIRRGETAELGMPQLASGEMGWSIDEQRLFIGNGSVAEGAPAVGNTEILTEARLFDLLSTAKFTSTNYTYAGRGLTATITGVLGANFPVVRTLQQKLDDNVTAFDFSATDSTDCTQKLQKAIDELYLRSFDKTLPKSRIPFRIPAGVYYTTATVFLPPFVTLIGDGIDKTVIRSISTSNTTIFATIDGDSTPSSRITGTNILSTNQPRQIQISGMTLENTSTAVTTQTTPFVRLDYTKNSSISEVKFKGTYAPGSTATLMNSGIDIGYNTNDIRVENCQFESLSYPIISDWNITDIDINENSFKDLYQGVTLAKNLTTSTSRNFGPSRVSIRNNKFLNIEQHGIFAGANTATNNQIVSESNHFINVANNGQGDSDPVTSIIKFESHGNSSINDNFERLWYMQTTSLDTPQYDIVEGTGQVKLKLTDRKIVNESTVTQTLVRIPYSSTTTSIDLYYTLEKSGLSRKGSLSVVAGPSGIAYKDSYAVAGSGDGDLILSADFLDHGPVDYYDTIAIQYTNPVSAGTGTLIFNLAYYK